MYIHQIVVLDSRHSPILVYKDTKGMTNHMMIIIIIITGVVVFSRHRPLSPGSSPEQLTTLPVSHCIMHAVPSIAVFDTAFIERFHAMASTFFLKTFVTIPVALITTGIILHFMFHIRFISVHDPFYSSSFPLPFARNLCHRLLPHLLLCMFSAF